jgi:hypothetical protein
VRLEFGTNEWEEIIFAVVAFGELGEIFLVIVQA